MALRSLAAIAEQPKKRARAAREAGLWLCARASFRPRQEGCGRGGGRAGSTGAAAQPRAPTAAPCAERGQGRALLAVLSGRVGSLAEVRAGRRLDVGPSRRSCRRKGKAAAGWTLRILPARRPGGPSCRCRPRRRAKASGRQAPPHSAQRARARPTPSLSLTYLTSSPSPFDPPSQPWPPASVSPAPSSVFGQLDCRSTGSCSVQSSTASGGLTPSSPFSTPCPARPCRLQPPALSPVPRPGRPSPRSPSELTPPAPTLTDPRSSLSSPSCVRCFTLPLGDSARGARRDRLPAPLPLSPRPAGRLLPRPAAQSR